MYLPSWKRKKIFEILPCYTQGHTSYFNQKIENPQLMDFWNFFVKLKKVRHLNSIVKDNPQENFISLDGDNALETAIDIGYLPLLKSVLKYSNANMLLSKDKNNLTVMEKFWHSKMSTYKEILFFIKKNGLEYIFNQNHMFVLIDTEIEKMLYFEKMFPGVFLNIYNKKIDNLNPHFQHVLLKNDILKTKLNKKFKLKHDKKIIKKI